MSGRGVYLAYRICALRLRRWLGKLICPLQQISLFAFPSLWSVVIQLIQLFGRYAKQTQSCREPVNIIHFASHMMQISKFQIWKHICMSLYKMYIQQRQSGGQVSSSSSHVSFPKPTEWPPSELGIAGKESLINKFATKKAGRASAEPWLDVWRGGKEREI